MSDHASPVSSAPARSLLGRPETDPVAPSIVRPRRDRVGRFGAAVIGAGVALMLATVLVCIPHLLLTLLPVLTRGVRAALATAWIVAATAGLLRLAASASQRARRDS